MSMLYYRYMKYMNKKLNTVLNSLAILSILTVGIISVPLSASADRAGYVTPYNSTRFNSVSTDYNYNYNSVPSNSSTIVGYYPPAQTTIPTVSSSTAIAKKATTTTIVKRTVATASTTAKTSTQPKEDLSTLPANVIYGSNSFIPSGLLQCILLAILILIIVILSRRVFNGNKRFHSSPLKHS